MRISDWSSDVCSSDLVQRALARPRPLGRHDAPLNCCRTRSCIRPTCPVLNEDDAGPPRRRIQRRRRPGIRKRPRPPTRAAMTNHFNVHHKADTVGVITVEGIQAGQELTGWIMENDETITLKALDPLPIGHKIAPEDST